MNLLTKFPELNNNQLRALYRLISEEVELSAEQREKLGQLLGASEQPTPQEEAGGKQVDKSSEVAE